MTGAIQRTRERLARHPVWFALSAFGGLLLVLGVIYASRYFPARAELDAAIAEARANGEPVWFSELDPGPERNPSADAELLLALAKEIVCLEYGDALEDKLHDVAFPSRADATVVFTQTDYERLAELAAANDRVLKEMAEVARRGDCWFKYDYSTLDTYSITLGHVDALSKIRSAALTHVLTTFDSEDDDAFVTALDDYLSLAESLQNEPFLVSCTFRVGWLDLGVTLIERRLNHATLAPETARILAERFAQLEQSLRIAPMVLENDTCILTSMANLDDPNNRTVVAAAISGASSWNTSRGNSSWFEEVLDATPEERQVARWNSLWNRPQLLKQLTFALNLRRRESEVIDVPGPVARKQLAASGAELRERQEEMPLLIHIFPDSLHTRDYVMQVRQHLISATLLLELAAKYEGESDTTHDLKGSIHAAIESAPAGYFSGNPLQYEIAESMISVFDVNPADGERVGEFSLKLFEDPQ